MGLAVKLACVASAALGVGYLDMSHGSVVLLSVLVGTFLRGTMNVCFVVAVGNQLVF